MKEIYFWDNKFFTLGKNPRLLQYTRQFLPIAATLSSASSHSLSDVVRKQISGDFTPTTAKMRGDWEKDALNYDNATKDYTPRYVMPHKIRHLLPQAKILFTLRNPTERLNSRFNKFNRDWRPNAATLHKLVVQCLAWFNRCRQFYDTDRCVMGNRFRQFDVPSYMEYLRAGCYSVFIRKWMEVFPPKQLLFLKFEDYAQDPVSSIERDVLPFLGLGPFDENIRNQLKYRRQKNRAAFHVKLRNDTRKLLDDFYFPFNRDLKKILGTSKTSIFS